MKKEESEDDEDDEDDEDEDNVRYTSECLHVNIITYSFF